ncbi:MAG TPA: hypothetical protein VHM02_11310, partial [Thermoanaerobaculia bacterium]|nr:hypothetical protein [Thermoanaerobaculia bacterium]
RRVAARARPELAAGRAVVTGGFVGRAPGGETTILGWEASDYSATLLGAALPAELVEIFSDVDGVFTADPRLVPGARLVPRLSYAEATDLAWLGAKVLHPKTMAPVARRGVPVRIRNSFRPEHEGTLVGPGVADAAAPRGVAAKGGLTPEEVVATVGATCGARLLDQLAGAAAGAAVEPESPFAPPPAEELERLARDGERAAGLALVSVVGAAWRPEVAARALAALDGVPHVAVPKNGCGEHRSWAVPEPRRADAVERLERALFAGAAE